MIRRPARTVQSTWLAMLVLQTIGSVDMKHRLPAPKQFVAINVLWSILFLVADSSFGRVAARLSILILLTATVLGPFGGRFVTWLQTITKFFATPPAPGTAQTTSGRNRTSQGPITVQNL